MTNAPSLFSRTGAYWALWLALGAIIAVFAFVIVVGTVAAHSAYQRELAACNDRGGELLNISGNYTCGKLSIEPR